MVEILLATITGILFQAGGMARVHAADFAQNANCGLVNPAFIETFDVPHRGEIL